MRVHRGKIDLGLEPEGRRLCRVVVTGDDYDCVEAVLECSAVRADDHAVPLGEGLIVGVVEAEAGARFSLAVLASFQLFKKLESSWLYWTKFTEDILVK